MWWQKEMNNYIYIIIFLISVFISSISQIVLKKSANKSYDSKLKEYLNPMVIGSYTIFFTSTLLTIFAYRGVPLSFGPILESTGYVYISVLGLLFLKEKLTFKKLCGNILIIIGILVFYLL